MTNVSSLRIGCSSASLPIGDKGPAPHSLKCRRNVSQCSVPTNIILYPYSPSLCAMIVHRRMVCFVQRLAWTPSPAPPAFEIESKSMEGSSIILSAVPCKGSVTVKCLQRYVLEPREISENHFPMLGCKYLPAELLSDQSGKALSYHPHLYTKESFHLTVVPQKSFLSRDTRQS